MAALQITNVSSSFSRYHRSFRASLHAPSATNLRRTPSIALPKLMKPTSSSSPRPNEDTKLAMQLHAVAEAAADRAEMHDIIGRQRDNWNHLFLHSVNSMALAAAVISAVSALPLHASPALRLALKLSSAALFAASTAMAAVAGMIQPSQLAEEQRNAARLFRQLERSVALRTTYTEADVEAAADRVIALDRAYPLPLLPGMLDKFPKKLEPTVWWPEFGNQTTERPSDGCNGWNAAVENELRGVARMIREKDVNQYVDFGNKVLGINRVLSVAAPVLCGLATAGALAGPSLVFVSVVGGALATVANALQHGGQAGMVVELSRNCAGFYKNLEEEIEFNLGEGEAGRREDGDVFKMKVALRLGRSVSELRGFGRDGSGDVGEFAGKLF